MLAILKGQAHSPNYLAQAALGTPFRKCILEGKQLPNSLYNGLGNPLASLNWPALVFLLACGALLGHMGGGGREISTTT